MKSSLIAKVGEMHSRVEAVLGLVDDLMPDVEEVLEQCASTFAKILESEEVQTDIADEPEEMQTFILKGTVKLDATVTVEALNVQDAADQVAKGDGDLALGKDTLDSMTFEWDGEIEGGVHDGP